MVECRLLLTRQERCDREGCSTGVSVVEVMVCSLGHRHDMIPLACGDAVGEKSVERNPERVLFSC